jgi:hypothetical protein
MTENQHPTLLDREAAAGIIGQHYAPQLELLTQMTNYASNLIPRAFNSSPKQLPDLIVCYALLKQFASMLDAMEILLRAGAVHAAFVPGRVAFEVSLYLEWMLVSDLEKKATHYYVGNMRAERNWGLRVQRHTPEGAEFLKDMGKIGEDVLNNRPAFEQDGPSHVADVNRILLMPEYVATDKAFDEYKKNNPRQRHEPDWYKVLGKRTLKEIARELGRASEYLLYYSKGSQVTHSQSYKDQFNFGAKGVAAHPIRNVADIHAAFNLAFCNAIKVFIQVLKSYRNEELPAFSRMYLTEWRQAFTNILEIKTESAK